MRSMLQPGNSVELVWRARLEDHLGIYTIEPAKLRAAELMESAIALQGLQLAAAHLRLLPERDPHPELYRAILVLLEHLGEPLTAAGLMVRFELAILDELGFGLDLRQCASTGSTRDLTYVSPKSGRAVSSEAGKPWHDRLLALPAFLAPDRISGHTPGLADLRAGFELARYFLERHVWEPRNLRPPAARDAFISAVERALASEPPDQPA